MSDAVMHDDSSFADSPRLSRLRARIGWTCHALRIAALVWAGWILVMVLVVWSDKAAVLQAYSRWLQVDLSAVSDARYAVVFALAIITWSAAAVVAACIWKLCGTYLAGRVFTVDAALWLRRTGMAGIGAVAIDVIMRLTIASILTGQFLQVPRGSIVFPHDLLHLIFAVFVLALAHIFKAAAEMADDHAQII